MTATQIDPRIVAEALGLDDTSDLARVLRNWAGEELAFIAKSPIITDEFFEDRLERFETKVARARKHLEAAEAAQQAWHDDNPPDEDDEA